MSPKPRPNDEHSNDAAVSTFEPDIRALEDCANSPLPAKTTRSVPRWLPALREELLVATVAVLLICVGWLTEPSLFSSLDFVVFYKQNFSFLAEAVKEGRLPLWNPYIGLGRPFLADLQNGVFYPPMYLVLFGAKWGAMILLWLHSYWLARGMKRFGCAIGINAGAAYAAGFAFLFSGVCATRLHAGQIMFVCGMSYIPWLFYYVTRLDGASARTIAQYAGLIALQFLTGHPQVFWLTGLGQVVFLLTRSLQQPVGNFISLATKTCLRFALANVWAALLSAVVLLPFLELVHYGNRATPTFEFVSLGMMNEWIKFFSLFAEPPASYFIEWEQNLFIGLGILVPGILGLTQLKNREMRAFLALILFATLIVVGDKTSAFKVFYHALPGFKSFRLHSRAGLLIVFSIISAAGIWISQSEKGKQALPTLIAIGVGFLVLILSFYPYHITGGGVIPAYPLVIRCILAVATCSLLAVSLRPVYRWINVAVLIGLIGWELGSSTLFYKKVWTFDHIMNFSPTYPLRASVLDNLKSSAQPQSPPMPPRVLLPWHVVPQNDGMLYHFSQCDAYTSLFLDRPWRYVHDLRQIPRPDSKNTFFAGDVYKQSLSAYPHMAIDVATDPENQKLVVNTKPMPRAFLVLASTNVNNADRAIACLRDGWNIYQIALAETRLNLPETTVEQAKPVQVKSFAPNEIVLDVSCDQNALLVLAEAWFPGWRAVDDGKTVDSIAVNGWMRAFPLSAGTKQLRIYYHQNYLFPGLMVSLAALAALAYVLSNKRLNRREQS